MLTVACLGMVRGTFICDTLVSCASVNHFSGLTMRMWTSKTMSGLVYFLVSMSFSCFPSLVVIEILRDKSSAKNGNVRRFTLESTFCAFLIHRISPGQLVRMGPSSNGA